uniref:Myotubularin-related protein 14 n=1 Tax=Lygus hesperus TaxID=30085 RepID=A0A146KSW7_LYGHE
MEDISADEINELLLYFSRNTFRARDADAHCHGIMKRCVDLVSLDYSHVVVSNAGGEMSAHYPSQLIIMEYERTSKGNNASSDHLPRANGTIYENVYDVNKLKDLFGKARFARCRARFPLPVILYKGKNICRSSTLAGGPEIYGRSGLDYFFSAEESGLDDKETENNDNIHPGDWQLFNRVRNQDIRLLKTLNVGAIIDFMVEKKKVKFGVKVTSSEKVDKESRYSDFTIISLPYPGCEFFKEYRDNDYEATGLVFDWSQGHVDAAIDVPDDNIASHLKIDWDNYKMWDLVKLTQNYMQLVLRYLVEQPLGLLIHCISGWDRTPLFVSLLRLSLWADGAIHQTLNAAQILYFTIAYDWMLFGHNLNDRLSKGEEIFFFCFYFLKHMLGEEFSVTRHGNKQRNGSVLRTDSDCQLEGLLLDTDAPMSSQGSNVSLNSSWSSISSKSQETPPVYFQPEDLGVSVGGLDSATGIGLRSERESCGNIQLPSIVNPNHSSVWSGSTSETDNILTSSESKAVLSSPTETTKSGGLNVKLQTNRTSPVAVPSKPPNIRQRNESTSSLSTGSWQFISGTGSLRGSGSNSTCGSHFSSNHSRTPVGENQMLGDSTSTIMEDDCFAYNSNCPDLGLRRERLRAVRHLFYNCYSTTVGFKMKNGSDGSGFGNFFFGNIADKVRFMSGQRTSV